MNGPSHYESPPASGWPIRDKSSVRPSQRLSAIMGAPAAPSLRFAMPPFVPLVSGRAAAALALLPERLLASLFRVRAGGLGSSVDLLRLSGLLCTVGLALACSRQTEAPSLPPETTSAPARNQVSASLDGTKDSDAEQPPAELTDPLDGLVPETRLTPGGKKTISGRHGLVTSVEEQATRAGVDILELGGNAVDAAVAVAFALAVTHPSAGNLGGGGFMLVHLGGPTEAIDFRETAPRALTPELFQAMIRRKARDGAAVGVPGTVAGLYLAHQRHGVLPWSAVVTPAIHLARDGHRIGKRQAKALGWSWHLLRSNDSARRSFADATGRAPVQAGQRVRLPRLAQALETIAKAGAEGFYRGPIAEDVVASLGPHGVMTLDDLASYEPKIRRPLRFPYRGWVVETMPPPSAGGVALTQTLLMLRESGIERFPPGSADAYHLIAESARRAHAERRFHVIDPDVLSPLEREARRTRWLDAATWLAPHPIQQDRASHSRDIHSLYDAASRELDHTTHFSVADAAGGVVSCTVTLSASFGSKIFTKQTGIALNNSVASFASAGENVVKGGQRTTSSMAPTLVLGNGLPALVLGSPGGDTIPNTITQVLVHLIDHGLPLDEAIDRPRIHHGFVPDAIAYERTRPPPAAILKELTARGHRLDKRRAVIGDANNLLLWGGDVYGYSDPREGGAALAARPRPERTATRP